MEFLTTEFGQDRDVDNIIENGFLPHFYQRGEDGWDPAELLSAPMRATIDADRTWRAHPTVQAFVDRLIEALPEFAGDADEARSGDHQDVLAFSFLASVVFRLQEALAAGEHDAPARATSAFALLDHEFGHDPEVDEVIALGAVENLPSPEEDGAQLNTYLGPRLRAELERQRTGRHS